MNMNINKIFINFSKRAEKIDRKTLVESFVDVGPLQTLLSTVDNQILYGRRGTGKTHALVYLSEAVKNTGDLSTYVDMRNIGSTGGIYSDHSLPLAERATRLLMDTLASIHDEILEAVLADNVDLNLAEIGPILDELAKVITEVSVQGTIETESTGELSRKELSTSQLSLGLQWKDPSLGLSSTQSSEKAAREKRRILKHGELRHRIHFGRLGSVLSKLSNSLGKRRLWLLIDEWSVVPIDLQPYLADLLRRSVFPIDSITTKIGAIEKRSRFQILGKYGDYLGIELGADASVDANMDDFMVFDNDEEKATEFFKNLLWKHFQSMKSQENLPDTPTSPDNLINEAFTQQNVFREFVRASEGIPRDAFYILSISAQRAFENKISMDIIRKSSKAWYQRDKEAAVSANQEALELLHWIMDKVISHRRARAFLLSREISHQLIDSLFDARVLHLLKKIYPPMTNLANDTMFTKLIMDAMWICFPQHIVHKDSFLRILENTLMYHLMTTER